MPSSGLLASEAMSSSSAGQRWRWPICGFTTVEQGLDTVERYYPGRPIEAKVSFFLEELLNQPPE